MSGRTTSRVFMDTLESRVLLHGGFGGGFEGMRALGPAGAAIEFSQAPGSVQTGLNTLASKDNVTAPAATDMVYLGNVNGVETYMLDIKSTGTDTRLTVDSAGNPFSRPTISSTTFGAISNTKVTDELTSIASALGLTAPASTDAVSVSTASDGTTVYTMRLMNSTTTGHHRRGVTISVDANGNPTGNAVIPFSALPSAIQNGLNANAPSGATPLDSSSTQKVAVRTQYGETTYSTTFSSSGTQTTVTVDASGNPATLPSRSSTDFGTLGTSDSAAATELQTLATADGAGTIDSAQNVSVLDEGNGTKLYSVVLTATGSSGGTHHIRLTVDQAGNPTVLPGGGGRGIFGGSGFAAAAGFGAFHSFGRRRG